MQCDICGEEVENSDELAKHKEKLHAMADSEQGGEREMETPEPEPAEPEPIIAPAPPRT